MSAYYLTLTPAQALAQARLTESIRDVVDAGGVVPCQRNPARWDDPFGSPTWCTGCPVLNLCAAYADTGAVEHGIMGGRRLAGSRERQRSAA